MERIARYLLERPEAPDSPAEFSRCEAALRSRLESRGADFSADAHDRIHQPDGGGTGRHRWESSSRSDGRWLRLRLDETAPDGTRRVVVVEVAGSASLVVARATVEAAPGREGGEPGTVDQRCPGVVRGLLDLPGEWLLARNEPIGLRRLSGEPAGGALAGTIADARRASPVVAVSEPTGPPGLAEAAARDLEGLALVRVLDAGAGRGLARRLGVRFAGPPGGVLMYRPGFSLKDAPDSLRLWSADRPVAPGDRARTLESVLRRLRRAVREATADDPPAGEVETMRAAAGAPPSAEVPASADAPGREPPSIAEPVDDDAPRPGEVRFYKKIASTQKYDIMIRVDDCGCGRWRPAGKPDKARKGIARVVGRDDWRTLQHCASCTGGGMWRVKW